MDRMLDATATSEETSFWFRHLRRTGESMLRSALDGISPRLIVDCGAGTGRNLDWLSSLGPAVGLELSETGLAHGRKRGRRMLRGSVTHLPFADGAADVVTSFDVLYCLEDIHERQAVREMHRVLANDGVALVTVAALDVLKGSHSVLTHERRRYTRGRLAKSLEAAGFTIERVTYTNMMTFPLVLAMRMAERLTGRGSSPSDTSLRVPPAPINAALDGALGLEHRLLKAFDLPVGSSVLAIARKTR